MEIQEHELTQDLFSAVIAAIQSVKPDVQNPTSSSWLIGDLGFDSIYIVDLLFELERKLGVELTVVDYNKFMRNHSQGTNRDLRVSDVSQFISEKIK